MKTNHLLMILFAVLIGFASCKKSDVQPEQKTTQPTGGGNNTNNTNTSPYPYYISYKDSGNYRVWQFYNMAITMNANNTSPVTEYMAFYDLSPNPLVSYKFKLFLPTDSSNLVNLNLNKKYISQNHIWYNGDNLPLSLTGCMGVTQTVSGGQPSDYIVNQTDTLNYYNKLDSVIFTNTYFYDNFQQQMLAVYIVKGQFKARIGRSGLSDRDWVTGEYRLKVNVRRQ